MTTHQPAEYSWTSGNPTPLMKIGQSLLCTGSSIQNTTCPNNFTTTTPGPHTNKMSKNGRLGHYTNTHKITYQLYTNSSRVVTSLLVQTYIKIKNLIHVLHNPCQSHMSAFFSKRPLMSAVFLIAPCTLNNISSIR